MPALNFNLQSLYGRTHSPRVISVGGAASSFFRLDYNEKLFARNYKDPVLLPAGANVVGKGVLAERAGMLDAIGVDLVAMVTNEIVAHGAEPLFFVHEIAVADPGQLAALVQGISDACLQVPCALLGGNIVIGASSYSGFAVGVIEKSKTMDAQTIEPGDSVIGLSSNGLHAAGFVRVNELLEKAPAALDEFLPDLNGTLGEELTRGSRMYAGPVRKLLAKYKVKRIIKAMAHVGAGGMPENLPRMLPAGLSLRLKRDAWTVPAIFTWLQKHGGLGTEEMLNTFNMGVGFAMVVRPTFTKPIMTHLRTLGEKPVFLGKVKKGDTPEIEWV